MPFEPAPKEISVADKLAALIEAGRASHPNMGHVRSTWLNEKGGCALTFAGLALGIPTDEIGRLSIAEAMGVESEDFEVLAFSVMSMNDYTEASLDEIVTAIRTNTFPPLAGHYMAVNAGLWADLLPLKITYYGNSLIAWDECVTKKLPKPKADPQPAKHVRVSAKTGKSWPVAKHAYA